MSLFHWLFRWLTGASAGYDCLRLEILMDYSEPIRKRGLDSLGLAAIRWTKIDENLLSTSERYNTFRGILVALHYAKILSAHDETRAELFSRTDEAVEQCILSEGKTSIDFKPWNLCIRDPVDIVGDFTTPIWPWKVVDSEPIEECDPSFAPVGYPKTYVETLKVGPKSRSAPGGFWSYLDMPMGGERVLAPASVLLAITTLSRELDDQNRQVLAILLGYVNRYYGSPNHVSLASEAKAVATAMQAILSAGRTVIK
ncbi:MAG TPA: hypothetical protein VFF49_03650 [Thermodesulfobacteriota bacterium]|nr:hypothetical protein [Thermodesulfobacteriota bacterium]